MKSDSTKLIGIILGTVLAAGLTATAKPVKVNISLKDDRGINGYVLKGDAKTLYVAPNTKVPTGQPVAWTNIASIYWEEPEDWKAAWKLWSRRDYAAAAGAFSKLTTDYANIAGIEDSVPARAAYYYAESLRRNGDYAKLVDAYEKANLAKLSGGYKKQIRLFNYWGHVGKQLWEPLQLITEKFEMDGAASNDTVPLATPPLAKIEGDLMVQIAYMRGISTEMLARKKYKAAVDALQPQIPETQVAVDAAWGEVKEALADYARVYTLTYGSDRLIAKQAMERSMSILKDDPDMKESRQLKLEAYALASSYKDLFGAGSVPAGYEAFLKKPKPPEAGLVEKEEAPKKPAAKKAAAKKPAAKKTK